MDSKHHESKHYGESSYQQCPCLKTISGGSVNFIGLQDYKWTVGSGKGFIPNRSYFRIDISLYGVGGQPAALQPTVASQIALAGK